MAIVATEVESVHGAASGQRLVYFRCRDDSGVWHPYGPVITSDPNYTPSAQLAMVAAKVAEQLAEAEAAAILAG
jgi:hypothetical protein